MNLVFMFLVLQLVKLPNCIFESILETFEGGLKLTVWVVQVGQIRMKKGGFGLVA